jgi:two-component system invasion response regulator UvrY
MSDTTGHPEAGPDPHQRASDEDCAATSESRKGESREGRGGQGEGLGSISGGRERLWRSRPRVAVVDPHPLLREKVAETVVALGGEIVWTAGNIREALTWAGKTVPDCVIFEFGLPDGSGARFLAQMRLQPVFLHGVALSVWEQRAYRALAYRAGALGYLSKTLPYDAVRAAIEHVWAGRVLWTAEEVAEAQAWWARCGEPWRRLSPRQRAVALGVAARLTNKEIAARAGVQGSTVKGYLLETLGKVGLSTRDELAAWMQGGSLTDPFVQPLLDVEDDRGSNGRQRPVAGSGVALQGQPLPVGRWLPTSGATGVGQPHRGAESGPARRAP